MHVAVRIIWILCGIVAAVMATIVATSALTLHETAATTSPSFQLVEHTNGGGGGG